MDAFRSFYLPPASLPHLFGSFWLFPRSSIYLRHDTQVSCDVAERLVRYFAFCDSPLALSMPCRFRFFRHIRRVTLYGGGLLRVY